MDHVDVYIESTKSIIEKIKKTFDIKSINRMEERLIKAGCYSDIVKKALDIQKQALSVKRRFQNRIPFLQHIIYMCIVRKVSDERGILSVISDLGYDLEEFSTEKLAERAGRFFNDLKKNSAEVNSLSIKLIVDYYENSKNKERITSKLSDSIKEKLNAGKKKKPTRARGNKQNIFDRWKKVNISMTTEARAVITQLLEKKLLPTDPEGVKLIKESGVDVVLVREYFSVLDEIAIMLDSKGQKAEIVQFLQQLTDSEIVFICDMEREGIAFGSDEFKKRYDSRFIRSSVLLEYSEGKSNGITLNEGEKEFFEELKENGINIFTKSNEEYRKAIAEYRRILSERQLRMGMLEQYFYLARKAKETAKDSEESVIEGPERTNPSPNPVPEATPTGLGLSGTPEEKLRQLYFKLHRLDAADNEFLKMVQSGKVDLAEIIQSEIDNNPLLRDNRKEVEELLKQVQSTRKKVRFFDRIKRHFTKGSNTYNISETINEEDSLGSRRR